MHKPILLVGNTGQLGQELEHILRPSYNNTLIAVGRPDIDLCQPETITKIIEEVQPKVIVNCAAYTAVDKAESEPELAHAVNGNAPGIIAKAAQDSGAFFLHVSTDYVFDGNNYLPYTESDTPNPLGIYGKSKLAGEEAIRQNCENHLIIRTAWVYGNHGKGNFVKTMLRLGGQREALGVVEDQIGTPTWTGDLAAAIAQLIPNLKPEQSGTYHYTNSGVASWYDFAIAIFEEAKNLNIPLKIERVNPITTSEYPTPARRPAYSVLSCGKISQLLGEKPPHWRESLRKMLANLT